MARRTVKRCSKCQEFKTRDNFSKNRAAKDGLQSYCKGCVRAYNQARNASNRPIVALATEETRAGQIAPETAVQSFDEIVRRLDYPTLLDFPWPFEESRRLTEEQDEALAGILIALMRNDAAGSKFLMSQVCETWEDVTLVMSVLLEMLIGVAGKSHHKEEIIWRAERVIGDRVASRA